MYAIVKRRGAALALASSALASMPAAAGEAWVLANEARSASAVLEEWLRPGERLDAWTEMVSRLEVREISSPLSVATDTRSRLEANCPEARWTWHRQLPDDVLYEFDSGICRDGSGPERELARLTRLPGTRTFKVSWSQRGPRDGAAVAYWRGVLDGPFGTVGERGSPPPAGSLRAGGARVAADDGADGRGRGRGADIDTDAELKRCEQAERPFECIAALQERLFESMPTEPAAARSSGRGPAAGGETASTPRAAWPAAGIRRVSLHLGKPDGGPRPEEVDRFLSTTSQFYAVAHYDRELGGRTIEFDWRYLSAPEGEQSISRRSLVVERGASSAISVVTFSGLNPVGRYRVDVYLDGVLAGQAHFVVERAGRFG